ncbi:Phosphoribulokinase [Tritrichomonas foetus]|uniref:Phosphoribulokinase n=1 Tax=Tritrichomonas foetus TaxID=1144522 RepID=A0A1J4JKF6_9EUKA|nr:Phosphoribulokinase [Tritrichomonas foetus]|eukprot:OHS99614.1 Phosphoribulokinase [Tritrichomonas foetus]
MSSDIINHQPRFFSVDYIGSEPMSNDDILANASLRVQQNAERATLIFITSCLYKQLFKRQLKVSHSLGDGLFCVDLEKLEITPNMIIQLQTAINEFLATHKSMQSIDIPRAELFKRFSDDGRQDKIGILKTISDNPVHCVKCGDFIDYALETMLMDLTRLPVFGLRPYHNGFVLRMPTLLSPNALAEWSDPAAQLEMFNEYTEWAELVGVDNIAKLNELIYNREVDDIKWVCEGLHQRKLANIASSLVAGYPEKRVVTIAGPSSSNKTTFAKRLAIALRVNGYHSLVIEMDDYFLNRDDTPFGPDGLRDFEAITALNVELLADRVHKLVAGESIPRRKFDFKDGVGIDVQEDQQKLGDKTFLILEGIHGLNPELLMHIGRDEVVPIYVAPLTPLSIDNTHRFPTTDLRLIRRIIRDHKYRGYTARKTIHRWTSVRMGEEKNIFPYQGNAEMFFNSSLVYELPVLSIFARSLLAEATVPEEDEDPNDPITKEITREARRLLGLANLFYAIPLQDVPHISCIREFTGGSDLKY